MKPRTKPCARPGCLQRATANCAYCSRSCAMCVVRARQTPERRRQIGLLGRQAQRADERARLLARVRVFADTEDARIVLAYQFGKRAHKTQCYRERQAMGITGGVR